MFTTSAAINQINRTHKRCLKAIFVHNSCDVYTFDQLLSLDSSITMHEMHLRSLLIEVYKALNELNPKFIAEFFTVKDLSHNLRNSNLLFLPPVKTFRYGVNSIHFRSCVIWNSLPAEIKTVKSLNSFKSKLRSIQIKCNCSVCRKVIISK